MQDGSLSLSGTQSGVLSTRSPAAGALTLTSYVPSAIRDSASGVPAAALNLAFTTPQVARTNYVYNASRCRLKSLTIRRNLVKLSGEN